MIIIHSLSSQFSSVLQSCTVLCDPVDCSMSRPPCPSPAPGACSNSCPLSQGCHPTISSSVVPFSPCHQSFPASGSFPRSQLFISGGQHTGALASVSVLPKGRTPCCSRDSQESSPAPQFETINCLALTLLYGPTLTSVHDYW